MNTAHTKTLIANGEAVLGIELGSTRIKAVLIDSNNQPIAQGGFDWQNSLIDGVWTYGLDEVEQGIQACFASLKVDVQERYGVPLSRLKALGVSAMMHGYLAFDEHDTLLVPFRTWRNTMTEAAAQELSDLFDYPVPERWSISHLYQAILNKEEHVHRLGSLTTLAGYVHFRLTGKKILGTGDGSGMFPVDTNTGQYDEGMLSSFRALVAPYAFTWDLKELLPTILPAGAHAGELTEEGARLLDPSGALEAGVPLCPPEGDAGTGMVATNSIAPRTGNVSAGTSVFAMVVLEHKLSKSYNQFIDLVTTPDGSLVAMSHGNNCTGEYDLWMRLFGEVLETMGFSAKKGELYDKILSAALEGDPDCGGLLVYNYLSGETKTGMHEGRPLFVRETKNNFTLANFMRSQLFTALGVIRIGMDILFENEGIKIDTITGHGGFFKTAEVGQKMMAAALHTPISTLTTAGEGGAWGIALLASYLVHGKGRTLADFLNSEAFADAQVSTICATAEEIEGFNVFMKRYKDGLPILREAIKVLK
ncbi:MAG TPA: FGGY-family carbohydrate kinase [Sphaerochaeta sp.]|jgi:sugar (pentulose or hexulose) kinase|nr:ATPase [Spirochaetales bacterium]HPY11336.1 FGGY-family carbohydrate kinase [Sphaerochaeta sp.]HQB90675.1 FGGY-family carbohydrate kinase [Sphaerochaeta sp.]